VTFVTGCDDRRHFASVMLAANVLRLRVRFLLCQVTHLSVNTQKVVA